MEAAQLAGFVQSGACHLRPLQECPDAAAENATPKKELLARGMAVPVVQDASVAMPEFSPDGNRAVTTLRQDRAVEKCGSTPVRNDHANDGLWKIGGKRQAVYAKAGLTVGRSPRRCSRATPPTLAPSFR